MALSPTSRTLKWLRDRNERADVVETFNMFSNTRKDLFGFADILTIRADLETRKVFFTLIQVTGGGNTSSRRKKILHDRTDAAIDCLLAGGVIEIHDWRKIKAKKKDGSFAKNKIWDNRITHVTLQDFTKVFE